MICKKTIEIRDKMPNYTNQYSTNNNRTKKNPPIDRIPHISFLIFFFVHVSVCGVCVFLNVKTHIAQIRNRKKKKLVYNIYVCVCIFCCMAVYLLNT